jgi:hypothetical protein
MRRHLLGALAALALVAVSACSSSDPTNWPIATYSNVPDNGSNLMTMTGKLQKVDGCVTVLSENGATFVPVFAMPGAKWRHGAVTINGVSVSPGETAHFSGGGTAPADARIPTACSGQTDYTRVDALLK